jgi:hypothetical protein
VLADNSSNGPVAPGLIAFLIVAVLGLVLWFLLKNMGKQLGRAQEHFEAEEAREATLAAASEQEKPAGA